MVIGRRGCGCVCRCGCRRECGWCFGRDKPRAKTWKAKIKVIVFCLATQLSFFLDIRAGLWYKASLTVSRATMGCNVKHVKQFVHSWWPTKNLLVSLAKLFPFTVIWIFQVSFYIIIITALKFLNKFKTFNSSECACCFELNYCTICSSSGAVLCG